MSTSRVVVVVVALALSVAAPAVACFPDDVLTQIASSTGSGSTAGASSGTGGAGTSGATSASSASSGAGGCVVGEDPCDLDCDGWPSWRCDGGDCNDLDPAVNPGASTYHTVPMMPGAKPGTKPFDYDCNGTDDPDPSQFVTQCGVGLSGPEADCARTCAGGTGDGRSPGPGFAPGASIACGTPGPLGTCSFTLGVCGAGWTSCSTMAPQACK